MSKKNVFFSLFLLVLSVCFITDVKDVQAKELNENSQNILQTEDTTSRWEAVQPERITTSEGLIIDYNFENFNAVVGWGGWIDEGYVTVTITIPENYELDTIVIAPDVFQEIADYIYSQMKEHIIVQEGKLIGKKVLPFVRIEKHNYSKIYKDDLYDYHQTVSPKELKDKIFTGFKKACHPAYKFDSVPEKDFVTCLESDDKVLKWLRPAPNQFNIIWNRQGNQYEPDFIVETEETIYMIEVKKDIDIATKEVQEKKKAGIKYCENATEYNLKNGKKEWKYLIIPSSQVKFSRNISEYEKLFFNKF